MDTPGSQDIPDPRGSREEEGLNTPDSPSQEAKEDKDTDEESNMRLDNAFDGSQRPIPPPKPTDIPATAVAVTNNPPPSAVPTAPPPSAVPITPASPSPAVPITPASPPPAVVVLSPLELSCPLCAQVIHLGGAPMLSRTKFLRHVVFQHLSSLFEDRPRGLLGGPSCCRIFESNLPEYQLHLADRHNEFLPRKIDNQFVLWIVTIDWIYINQTSQKIKE